MPVSRYLLAILCVLICRQAIAQTVFTEPFDTGPLEDCLAAVPAGATLEPLSEGGACLLLPPSVRSAELKPMAATSGSKYRLSYRARIDGENTVETNDRLHIEMHRTYGRFLPACEITFFDAEGTPVEGIGDQAGGAILTGEWYPYVHVFQTPPGTAAVRVRFLTRERDLRIDALELALDDEDEAVNCNPDFRYGELNYCGWRPARDGRLYLRPDGKTVFNSGYGGSSPWIPLHEDHHYRIYAAGLQRNRSASLTMHYFAEDGSRLGNRFLLRPEEEGGHVDLTPPPRTRYARVVMYNVILTELNVMELKKANP